ncbi:MAG: hypothetical protein V2B18_16195, partial [Pseudomonadota bacterium]
MNLPINHFLLRLPAATLKSFAKELQLPRSIARKTEVADELASRLESDLPAVIDKMSNPERMIIADVAHHGRPYDPALYKARFPGWSIEDPPKGSGNAASLVSLFCYVDRGRYEMPEALADKVRKLLRKPSFKIKMTTADKVPEEIKDEHSGTRPVRIHIGNAAGLLEPTRVLSAVKAGKVGINPSNGRPSYTAQTFLEKELIGGDFQLGFPLKSNPLVDVAESSIAVKAAVW